MKVQDLFKRRLVKKQKTYVSVLLSFGLEKKNEIGFSQQEVDHCDSF